MPYEYSAPDRSASPQARRSHRIANNLQDTCAVLFTSKRYIEISGVQLEQRRQKIRIVNVRAVRGIPVAAWTCMDTDASPIVGGEAAKHENIQIDE